MQLGVSYFENTIFRLFSISPEHSKFFQNFVYIFEVVDKHNIISQNDVEKNKNFTTPKKNFFLNFLITKKGFYINKIK